MDYLTIPEGTVVEVVGQYDCEIENCSNLAAFDNVNTREFMGLPTSLVVRVDGVWRHWCFEHIKAKF